METELLRKAGKIDSKIKAIMAEIGHVEKLGKNVKQSYAFRRVDDVYAAAQPLFAKHGVYTVCRILSDRSEERRTQQGSVMMYRILHVRWYFVCHEDDSFTSTDVMAEGSDTGDKASNKAMSVGHKYAICQVLCIPTDEPKDPENDSNDFGPRTNTEKSCPETDSAPKPAQSRALQQKAKKTAPQPLSPAEIAEAIAMSFAEVSVSRAKLEKFLNCKLELISEDQRNMLRDLLTKIHAGNLTVDMIFGKQVNATVEELNNQFG